MRRKLDLILRTFLALLISPVLALSASARDCKVLAKADRAETLYHLQEWADTLRPQTKLDFVKNSAQERLAQADAAIEHIKNAKESEVPTILAAVYYPEYASYLCLAYTDTDNDVVAAHITWKGRDGYLEVKPPEGDDKYPCDGRVPIVKQWILIPKEVVKKKGKDNPVFKWIRDVADMKLYSTESLGHTVSHSGFGKK